MMMSPSFTLNTPLIPFGINFSYIFGYPYCRGQIYYPLTPIPLYPANNASILMSVSQTHEDPQLSYD